MGCRTVAADEAGAGQNPWKHNRKRGLRAMTHELKVCDGRVNSPDFLKLTARSVHATVRHVTAVGPEMKQVSTVLTESTLPPSLAAAFLLGGLIVLPVAFVIAARAIGRRSQPEDAVCGWCRLLTIPYVRYFQRLKVEGRHFIPKKIGPEGFILVSTHGAGLDPVVLQSQLRFTIRWMMSAEMMVPVMAWLWRRMRIIPVCFDSRDVSALKAAIDHVNSGGALAIFPEGAIEVPARQLRPFSGGLRLILARTKAPVLVATIEQDPVEGGAYGALMKPLHPKLRFIALVEAGPNGHGRDTAERIFEMMREATGWPVNTEPPAPPNFEVGDRNLRVFLSGR